MKMKHPDSCGHRGGLAVIEALRAEIDAQGLRREVTVRPSPCLDCCGDGPVVAIYDGANREFSQPPDGLLGFFTKKPRIERHVSSAQADEIVRG